MERTTGRRDIREVRRDDVAAAFGGYRTGRAPRTEVRVTHGNKAPQVQVFQGRRHARTYAHQMADRYQADGYRVSGSEVRGYRVEDRMGLVATITTRDLEGPFGRVAC